MNKLLTLIIFIGTLTCFSQNSNEIIINLKQEKDISISNKFNYQYNHLRTIKRYPILEKYIIKNYKNIPKNDSIRYFASYENKNQFFYDYLKSGKISKEEFAAAISEYRIDTLQLSKKNISQGKIVLVGFLKNQQFVVLDSNKDEDFKDEEIQFFDINFRDNQDIFEIEKKLKVQKPIEYEYQIYDGKKIVNLKKWIQYFPSKISPSPVDKYAFEYTTRYIYRDYWKGEKKIGNVIYEFYYQSYDNIYGDLIIKPKNIKLTDDVIHNNQFYHNTEDIIMIEGNKYKIDKISSDISKLYLSKVESEEKKYGNTINNYLKNYSLKDLNDNEFSTDEIIKSKKYTLIDFWGTWCGPCLKMTPELILLLNKYKEDLNIISIAKDTDINKVKTYVDKKEMNWHHSFTKEKINSEIMKDFNIMYYPTFILIDNNGKILSINGAKSFKEIEKIIKKGIQN